MTLFKRIRVATTHEADGVDLLQCTSSPWYNVPLQIKHFFNKRRRIEVSDGSQDSSLRCLLDGLGVVENPCPANKSIFQTSYPVVSLLDEIRVF
jgi:hypothetical protein